MEESHVFRAAMLFGSSKVHDNLNNFSLFFPIKKFDEEQKLYAGFTFYSPEFIDLKIKVNKFNTFVINLANSHYEWCFPNSNSFEISQLINELITFDKINKTMHYLAEPDFTANVYQFLMRTQFNISR